MHFKKDISLKEKLLAAHRGGIATVIIPHENARDLKEIPENVKSNLEIVSVKWMDEVLALGLESVPVAKSATRKSGRIKEGSASQNSASARKKRRDNSVGVKTH